MDKPPASALIVILGARVLPNGQPSGALRRRVAAAIRLARGRSDCLFVPSGGVGDSSIPEWRVMRDLLIGAGIPAEAIFPETEGVDTLSQVRLCLPLVARHAAGREVFVSTSRYHQARAWLLFRLHGVIVRVAPALPDRPFVSWRKLVYFWLREVAAIPYDVSIVFFARRRSAAIPHALPGKTDR